MDDFYSESPYLDNTGGLPTDPAPAQPTWDLPSYLSANPASANPYGIPFDWPPPIGPASSQSALSPPPDLYGDVNAKRAAYLAALSQMYSNAPPQARQPSFGSRDLAWAVPALLAALTGHNGQQLAAGLVSGGLQANKSTTDAANQQQLANWQFRQQQLANAAQVAGQAMGFAQNDLNARLAALGQGAKTGAGSNSNPIQSLTPNAVAPLGAANGGPTPGQTPAYRPYDFYGQYPAAKVSAKLSELAKIAAANKVASQALIRAVTPYPLDLQAGVASAIAPILTKDPSTWTQADLKAVEGAYQPVLDRYERRLNDPMQTSPLTPDELQIYKNLKKKMNWLDSQIDD